MVQIIFAIQWLVTGTIGAFPKCLLMLIKKNLASEVLWKKKKASSEPTSISLEVILFCLQSEPLH